MRRHKKSLSAAIRSGINLIDTRTNCAEGGSETPVGQVLEEAIDAVSSIYLEEAARVLNRIRYALDNADPGEKQGVLSQKAIRALRSTAGVSAVLVGMRSTAYVEDVLIELKRPTEQKAREGSRAKLRQGIKDLFPTLG